MIAQLWASQNRVSVRPSGELQAGTHRLPSGGEGPTLTMELLMKKSRKSLTSLSARAYLLQSGRCFYCGALMWRKDSDQFASQYNLSPTQTMHLKCTGEHLIAHCEGGSASRSNIVAACRYCNSRRHQAVKPLTPDRYKKHVRKCVAKGHWHQFRRLCG